MWLLLLVLLVVPSGSGMVWMWSGRFRRYRYLFAICVIVAIAGGFEAWQYRAIPKSFTASLNLPMGPGEPDMFLESDLTGVMFELYPDRSESLFLRGFQIKLCNDQHDSYRRYAVCEQYGDSDLATVRSCFEQALLLKAKSDENLYYHYVEILIRQGAAQDEIDEATLNWKRLFPLSDRIDPRVAFSRAAPEASDAAQPPK